MTMTKIVRILILSAIGWFTIGATSVALRDAHRRRYLRRHGLRDLRRP